MKIGTMVKIKDLSNANDRLLYSGFRGVVTMRDELVPTFVLVDADEYVRRTGRRQAVSFSLWFMESDLEEIGGDEAKEIEDASV